MVQETNVIFVIFKQNLWYFHKFWVVKTWPTGLASQSVGLKRLFFSSYFCFLSATIEWGCFLNGNCVIQSIHIMHDWYF